STNVEDRRGMGIPGLGGGGMKVGLGGLVIALIASLLFGIDPTEILTGGGSAPVPQPPPPGYGPQTSAPAPGTPAKGDTAGEMMRAVLGDTEDVWKALFESAGQRAYRPPNLVLFDGRVNSACGFASAAVGPFYCPGDRKLYLDTAFFNDLARRFGAPGDFAAAYVVAHEVGHHVQNLLGTMQQFDSQMGRLDPRARNQMQVRLELQADCYAGVWGYFAQKRNRLEPGDLEEGMRAAAAVGDDMIMKRTQGYVVPDAFTHGSAEQRVRWFRKGLSSGDPRQCDTFSVQQP
ncbi:MAG TPA: neutral zinc metallopeptidase, partial [Casimicrobiaceae bacterium]|nr:neutral zinc metallopeptidase [Casimicrobiaceae bacterium]